VGGLPLQNFGRYKTLRESVTKLSLQNFKRERVLQNFERETVTKLCALLQNFVVCYKTFGLLSTPTLLFTLGCSYYT
jgi:hypothetical protein